MLFVQRRLYEVGLYLLLSIAIVVQEWCLLLELKKECSRVGGFAFSLSYE